MYSSLPSVTQSPTPLPLSLRPSILPSQHLSACLHPCYLSFHSLCTSLSVCEDFPILYTLSFHLSLLLIFPSLPPFPRPHTYLKAPSALMCAAAWVCKFPGWACAGFTSSMLTRPSPRSSSGQQMLTARREDACPRAAGWWAMVEKPSMGNIVVVADASSSLAQRKGSGNEEINDYCTGCGLSYSPVVVGRKGRDVEWKIKVRRDCALKERKQIRISKRARWPVGAAHAPEWVSVLIFRRPFCSSIEYLVVFRGRKVSKSYRRGEEDRCNNMHHLTLRRSKPGIHPRWANVLVLVAAGVARREGMAGLDRESEGRGCR